MKLSQGQITTELDRLFKDMREKITPNCSQGMGAGRVLAFERNGQEFIGTCVPKKEFFDGRGLKRKGIKIAFQLRSEEKYEALKKLAFAHFGGLLTVSVDRIPAEGFFAGNIRLRRCADKRKKENK